MKRSYYLLLSILISIVILSQENVESIFVEYKYISSDVKEAVPYPAILQYNGGKSLFTIQFSKVGDDYETLMKQIESDTCKICQNNKMIVLKGIDQKYFRNENNEFILERASGGKFIYAKDSVNLSWELGNKKDTILGFPCQNAFTEIRGRKYEVFYTQQIPLPLGPWKLYGLPGMILKAQPLYYKKYSFEATAVVLNPSKELVLINDYTKIPEKDILTWEEFEKTLVERKLNKQKSIISNEKDQNVSITFSANEGLDGEYKKLQKEEN